LGAINVFYECNAEWGMLAIVREWSEEREDVAWDKSQLTLIL
jgi:hypothetical protein